MKKISLSLISITAFCFVAVGNAAEGGGGSFTHESVITGATGASGSLGILSNSAAALSLSGAATHFYTLSDAFQIGGQANFTWNFSPMTFGFGAFVVPQFNFGDSDISRSYFLNAKIGVNITAGTGAMAIGFGAGIGKRFVLMNNVIYRPEITWTMSGSAQNLALTLIAISITY